MALHSTSDSPSSDFLNVLHVTEAADGGVLKHLSYILPELQNRGCACGCFVFSARAGVYARNEVFPLFMKSGVNLQFLNLPPCWQWKLRYWKQIRQKLLFLIRQYHPQIIHLHSSFAGVVGRLFIPKSMHVKIVYSPHAFSWDRRMNLLRRGTVSTVERILAKRTDHFSFVGNAELFQANEMGLKKIHSVVAPNGLPVSFHAQIKKISDAKRIANDSFQRKDFLSQYAILIPGRIAWQKGQKWLLDVLLRLSFVRKEKECHFYFCGDGKELKMLQRRCSGMPFGKRIHFVGYEPWLPQCMRAFDLAIIPSRYEGLSYTILELVASGVMILASDIPANHLSGQEENKNIVFFHLEDEVDFQQKLLKCINEDRYLKIEIPGKICYGLTRQIDLLLKEYQNLFEKKEFGHGER
ncbi:MAG: glycosyltransferase family 4 protein [Lentisphaeria bacterium]